MRQISDELKLKIWQKGKVDPNYMPEHVRKDACGAWMIYDEYGNRDSPFGWEIDHICPQTKLRNMNFDDSTIDSEVNLRPLHWANNKSKGDDYPIYQSSIIADGNTNISKVEEKMISKTIQDKLSKLYKLDQ